jgi:hypothetical protein
VYSSRSRPDSLSMKNSPMRSETRFVTLIPRIYSQVGPNTGSRRARCPKVGFWTSQA